MEVKYSQEKVDALNQHMRGQLQYERKGFHLSDAIFCNYKPFIRERFNIPETDEQISLFWSGHAYQYFLQPAQQADSKVFEVDGVYMTPDMANEYFAKIHFNLAELKSTRGSMGYFQKDVGKGDHHYIRQMKGYCKALKTRESSLIIFFLMGDYYNFTMKNGTRAYCYKDGGRPFPVLQVWDYEFEQEEIDTWWVEVLRRKKIFDDTENGGLPSEHMMAFENECLRCECSVSCPHYEGKVINGEL